MQFVIPSHYGNTELTGRQQVASQGINVIGQGLTSFFNWKTAQTGTGIQPSSGGGYYTPPPQPQEPNYTPLIIGSIITAIAIGGVILVLNRGKKK